jgi:SRSO17 transposase
LVKRLVSATPPPSGRKPAMNIAPLQVEGLLDDLQDYHEQFVAYFGRREQRYWAQKYMEGQLLALERKSIEAMASALVGGNVQAMQQFIGVGRWADEPIIKQHQREVAHTLGEPDGIVIVDGCDFPKQGQESVGVARQYCGALGKLANCQASVLLAYASSKGHTLLDRRLYLPEEWLDAEHAERRKKCGVPEPLPFQTKPALAWDMLAAVCNDKVVPFQWVAMDAGFGRDLNLLNHIEKQGKFYFAEINCSTLAWKQWPAVVSPLFSAPLGRPPTRERVAADAPPAVRVDQLGLALAYDRWHPVIVHEGSKGPLAVEITMQRMVFREDQLPAREEWLVIRRTSKQQLLGDWKFFRCNAPASTPFNTLARLTAWRWPIETTIEECKGELGLDHYEVRGWTGWHHHFTMTMLSHHFLVRVRIRLGHDAPALTVSQARRLLQVVLPKREFDAQAALTEIERIQKQNHAAYRSHRKRRLRHLCDYKPK